MPPTGIRRVGLWGKPTSLLDWCEDNYDVTDYIAEFWNTVSNWIMIVPPLIGAWVAVKENMETRIVLCYLSLAMVGIGSLGFHCTLLYEMELLDELPMVFGSCCLLYAVMTCDGKEHKANKPLAWLLAFIALGITVIYISVPNPLIFQWAYGLLAATFFLQSLYRCRKYNGSSLLAFTGLISYGFGFILWNIDNNFCVNLRAIRSALHCFVQPITQCHAWWHLFAGAGSYISVLFCTHLRLRCLGIPSKLVFYWNVIPFVTKEKSKSSSFSNNNEYVK